MQLSNQPVLQPHGGCDKQGAGYLREKRSGLLVGHGVTENTLKDNGNPGSSKCARACALTHTHTVTQSQMARAGNSVDLREGSLQGHGVGVGERSGYPAGD